MQLSIRNNAASPPSNRLSARISFRAFCILLLLVSGLAALFFFTNTIQYLPVTGDNMYPEAAGVLAAQRWALGLPLYEDYRQAPYLITHFPPLWYALLAAATRVGMPADVDSLTLLGRIFSLIFLFGSAALAYSWNRKLGLPALIALCGPTFYLALPILIPWAVTARPDFPALFLGFLAVYLVVQRSSSAFVCCAAIAAALTFLVRHNAVAAPVSVVLWLLWLRRWKHAALFCSVWAVVVLGVLLAFQQSSHGLLLLNLSGAKFGALAVTYARDTLFRLLASPGHSFAIVLFAFGIFSIVELWNQRDKRTRLVSIYAIIAFGFAVFGSAAAGAAENHFLEPAFAMSVLLPAGLSRLGEGWSSESPLASFATVILLLMLLLSLDIQRWNVTHSKPEDLRSVLPVMKGRYVFTDIPYLAARTAPPQFLDLVSLTFSQQTGGRTSWSSRSLVEDLQKRKYELLVLHERADVPYDAKARYPRYPRLDSAVRAAIGEHYRLCFDLNNQYIYARRPADQNLPGGSCPADN